ncbi:MAG: hypothetical protein QM831_04135 [Kofleriaceae bacterium]
MGYELRIRASARWASPPDVLVLTPDIEIRVVDPTPSGYTRVTYELRSTPAATMPDAHIQVEDDGFYVCENGSPVPGLLEHLIRHALRTGPVTIEEL